MVVSKYPLTILKAALFSCSLSAEVTGIVQLSNSQQMVNVRESVTEPKNGENVLAILTSRGLT